MLLKKIVLRNENQFATAIVDWANKHTIDVEIFDGKESLFDIVDSLVVFQEDHNVPKETRDLQDSIEKFHNPALQIDINATMSASVASLLFWLENNKPKCVLFVGEDKITESARFEDYMGKLAKGL